MLDNIIGKVGHIHKYSDVVLSVLVVCLILILVIPLPPILMDTLLSFSIVFAVTTLLVTIYTEDALEFNSFPSLLLLLTLFRLGLNIASTRMILAEGQAGDIIATFGEFVTGGSKIVGLVIFVLLTVINFVVITKGSGRIAEVAARFILDAMPGKQMSIDADLNAGIINVSEARLRREEISREADFYGSMDGASKFVRGDAIAGIIITLVNIIGGLTIGISVKGMAWMEAVDTYTVLTIGDGLVSQIPALLISVGAGIIVTRASSKEKLGQTLHKQIFNNPKVLFVTASIVLLLGLLPGMPMLVMAPIALTIIAYSYVLWKSTQSALSISDSTMNSADATEDSISETDAVKSFLYVDPMEIELGYGLIKLIDQNGDLLSRITIIRKEVASELGMIVPPIRIRDNMELDANIYIVKVKGIEVDKGSLQIGNYLAMNPGNVKKQIQGIPTEHPFGLESVWISADQRENAEMLGYTVVDTLSVLSTHLTEIIYKHANELLNRQEVSRLIENAKEYASAVIDELIPNQLILGQVLQVLKNLLRERIPIRDIVTILEVLADHSIEVKDVDVLTEYVRQGLARTITKQYMSKEYKIYAITLDPKVEQMISESINKTGFGNRLVLRPSMTQKIIEELRYITRKENRSVVITTPGNRSIFKKLIQRELPKLPILSYNEIVSDVEIENIGIVSSEVLI